ncbi:serine/threonine-protein kinase [Terrabacter sp. NPDC000476]|uniref:serine/threonine-protein kinase n=1 Tax=Terrabacter sp. NPDC000476 TaxID=3154258 RepID=UPI0033323D1F
MGTDPAQVIAGRYRLLGRIGSGGMGHVWHAWDDRLSRAVAVKQLHSLAGLPEAEAQVAHERAMREARITARLHHPNAVPVFDVVDHDGRPCLVMQYLPSRSLQQLLADEGPLAPTEAARIGSQVASALAAAHRADIVHRDVKPGNVLIAEDGTARITDFGISHALGDASLTSTGMVTGTPAYLAPEVARGASSSPASDVFSLGATVYAATEGEPPFGTAANAMALLHRVASGAITAPTDGPLAPVLLRMLAAAPEDRPSMQQAARELAAVAAGAAPSAGASTPAGAATETVAVTRAADVTRPQQVTPAVGATRALPVATPSGGTPSAAASSGAAPSGAAPSGGTSSGSAPRRRRRTPMAVLAVLVAGGLGVLGYSLLGGDDPGAGPSRAGGAAPTSSAPAATTPATPSRTPSVATSTAPPVTAPTTSPATPSGTAGTSDEPTPSAPSSTDAGGTLTSDSDLAGAVRDYYALLPGDTEAGWSRLSDRYRSTTARDRATYESFWGSVRSVDVRQAAGSAPGTAQATIRYAFRDGRRFEERTTYRFVEEGGLLKIDASTVRSSRQL